MSDFTKDPNARLPYGFNWGKWLTSSDGISSSQWVVSAGSGGISIGSASHTASGTTVVISGGNVGSSYAFTNTIVTSAGNQDDRTFTMDIANK